MTPAAFHDGVVEIGNRCVLREEFERFEQRSLPGGRRGSPHQVGAASKTARKNKTASIEDALHATHAAVEEDIVPGAGVAVLRASVPLGRIKFDGDGVTVVRRGCENWCGRSY